MKTYNSIICTFLLGLCGIGGHVVQSVDTSSIVFNYCYGSNTVLVPIQSAVNLLSIPTFDIGKKTVFYVHGFTENMTSESVVTVRDAYLQRGDHNVVLVDWSVIADNIIYPIPAANTKPVGQAVATQILKLIAAGLQLPLIHLVGHSLGGQVVGFVGKATQQKGVKLPRISGLDPAFEQFYPAPDSLHISETDADVVDVIHTNPGGYGAPVTTGSIDFWANYGEPIQPGCPVAVPLTTKSFCSHWRSWRYWAESLNNEYNFQAVECYDELLVKNCSGPKVYMGIAVDLTVTGEFYLSTYSSSPYGEGQCNLTSLSLI